MIYPWHSANWRIISEAFTQQRYPHALLLEGPMGLGKNDFALACAAKILCNPLADQACGHCQSCILWAAQTHPDFYTLTPIEKAKSISITQVRERVEQLTQTPHLGAFQVIIISPAEAMNRAASNALLKTLEEPLGQVIMILVSHQLSGIPATILSRCQRLRFVLPAYEQTVPWLVRQGVGDERAARDLLHKAGGAPLKALEWGSESHTRLRQVVVEKLWELLQYNPDNRNLLGVLADEEAMLVLQIMFSIALDVFKLCLKVPDYSLENRDFRELLNQMPACIHRGRNELTLASWLPQCLAVQERLRVNPGVNAALALEVLLLGWQQLGAVSYVKTD